MKTRCFVLLAASLMGWAHCPGQHRFRYGEDVVLTILCDDRSVSDALIADQGFACLIESGQETILFDAGRIPGTLIRNMDWLNLDYSDIDYVFISHIHDDHMGGLQAMLARCNKPTLYMPFSYPQLIDEPPSDRADSDWLALLDQYKSLVSALIRVKEPAPVGESCYSTGAIEQVFYEQSLIIPTSKGLVILTGCSHPGILETVKHAKKLMNRDVNMVLGGFHLVSSDPDEISKTARGLRKLTKYIGPCHCTGKHAMKIFQDVFKEDYLDIRAGSVIHPDAEVFGGTLIP